ncbi:MAG TPA: type II secretion system protein [Oculatellaceae cyanobacterium]|jgi:prepilin-type N-terminal cleavage/methylation domain-containing protein
MFKLTRKKTTAGFTLIEVMAAILILTFFLAVTMQAMVIAAMFKVKAKRYTEATAWIQQDIETIRNKGSQLGMNMQLMLPVTSAATKEIFIEQGSSLTLTPTPSKIVIGDASKTFTVAQTPVNLTVPDPINIGNTIDVTKITVDSPIGQTLSITNKVVKVVEVTKCYATNSASGFGQYLQDSLGNVASTTKIIAGQTYAITRTPSPKDAVPYNVLGVTYKVTPQGKTTPVIAENYSEVIPDASLYCPQ